MDDLLLLQAVLHSGLLLVLLALSGHSAVLRGHVHHLSPLESLLLVLLEVLGVEALLHALVLIFVTLLLLLKTVLFKRLQVLSFFTELCGQKALLRFVAEDLGSSLLSDLLNKKGICK